MFLNLNCFSQRMIAVALMTGLSAVGSQLDAAIVTINAAWTPVANNPVGNMANVIGQFTFDPDVFQFKTGNKWYYFNGAGQWSTSGVVVTGSTTALANTTFVTADFTDLIIESAAATPLAALTAGDLQIVLGGALGFPTRLPPNASGPSGHMQVGSGGTGGYEFVAFSGASFSAVPEPGTLSLCGLALTGFFIPAVRNRFRRVKQV